MKKFLGSSTYTRWQLGVLTLSLSPIELTLGTYLPGLFCE